MKKRLFYVLLLAGVLSVVPVGEIKGAESTDVVVIDQTDWEIEDDETETTTSDDEIIVDPDAFEDDDTSDDTASESSTDTTSQSDGNSETGADGTDTSSSSTTSTSTDTSSTSTSSTSTSSTSTSSTSTGSTSSTGGSTSSSTSSSSSSSSTRSNSSDSSLKRLSIDPGTISPAFSADVFEYTARVDAGVTQISVGADPNDANAVIASVSGAKSISAGENTVKVVVEAADRSTSEYIIKVFCGEGNFSETPYSEDTSVADASEGEPDDIMGEGFSEGEEDYVPGEEDDIDTTEIEPLIFDSPEVELQDDGRLYYDGTYYVPEERLESLVSVEKYNTLNDKYKAERDKFTTAVVVGVLAAFILLVLLINVLLRRKLGDDGQGKEKKKKDKKEKKEKKEKAEKPEKKEQKKERVAYDIDLSAEKQAPKSQNQAKESLPKPPKGTKRSIQVDNATDEDMEIMDLDDL